MAMEQSAGINQGQKVKISKGQNAVHTLDNKVFELGTR